MNRIMLTHFSAYALSRRRCLRPCRAPLWRRRHEFFAVPQHTELLQHFNMFQRAGLPAHVTADKSCAIAINARDEGKYPLPFPDFLQSGRDPGNRRPGKVKRIAFSIQHDFYRIRVKRFFGAVNRHRQRRHANPALRQIFRDRRIITAGIIGSSP